MPSGGSTDWVEILFFAGLATLLAGVAFIAVLEGWRRWSDNRRIRKHLRN
jgi:hypothetical protein